MTSIRESSSFQKESQFLSGQHMGAFRLAGHIQRPNDAWPPLLSEQGARHRLAEYGMAVTLLATERGKPGLTTAVCGRTRNPFRFVLRRIPVVNNSHPIGGTLRPTGFHADDLLADGIMPTSRPVLRVDEIRRRTLVPALAHHRNHH